MQYLMTALTINLSMKLFLNNLEGIKTTLSQKTSHGGRSENTKATASRYASEGNEWKGCQDFKSERTCQLTRKKLQLQKR